jgi:hypothetical protein
MEIILAKYIEHGQAGQLQTQDGQARKSCAPSDRVSTQNQRHASQIDINPSRLLTCRLLNKNIRIKTHGTLNVRACVQLIC